MLRILVVCLVVLFTACGGGVAGRCTSDSQCPAGSSCDTHLGVCSSGGSGAPADGGSGGFGGLPGLGGGSGALAANYGRQCSSGDACSDVAASTCLHIIDAVNACYSKSPGCPAGTRAQHDIDGSYCLKTCTTAMNCPTGQVCSNIRGNLPFLACVPAAADAQPAQPAPVGAACTADSDCANGKCALSAPGGYCSGPCNSDADCGSGGACLQDTSSSTGAACYAKCFSPGSASSACRTGYSCAAVPTVSWGVCWPQ